MSGDTHKQGYTHVLANAKNNNKKSFYYNHNTNTL